MAIMLFAVIIIAKETQKTVLPAARVPFLRVPAVDFVAFSCGWDNLSQKDCMILTCMDPLAHRCGAVCGKAAGNPFS